MVRRKIMTHEEHVELAETLSDILPKLHHAATTVGCKLGVTSEAYKYLCRTIKRYDDVRCALDNEYHKVTSSTQFVDRGHVYYEARPRSNTSGKQLS